MWVGHVQELIGKKGKKLLISYNRNRIPDMEWKCTEVMKQSKLVYGWEDESLVLTKFIKWSIASNYTPWWRCQPTCRKPSNGYEWLTQNHAFLNPNNISISNIPLSTRSWTPLNDNKQTHVPSFPVKNPNEWLPLRIDFWNLKSHHSIKDFATTRNNQTRMKRRIAQWLHHGIYTDLIVDCHVRKIESHCKSWSWANA